MPKKACVRRLPHPLGPATAGGCRSRWGEAFEITFESPSDDDCPDTFAILEYIDEVASRADAMDGVFSSSDYPGATVAGAIANRRGLPGPAPEHVIGCSHKFYSRCTQQAVAPEATPWFGLVDPKNPDPNLPFPVFLKPVKGAFSQLARRIASHEALLDFVRRPAATEFFAHYMRIFDQLVVGLTDFEHDGQFFIAEGVLAGDQTTVEGFIRDGEVKLLGIVDSILHPVTRSFVRFDYPSALPCEVQARMEQIASDVIRASGLEQSFFNIEMIHDPSSGSIHILEVNPRICGQFADLYEKVDGRNTYEIALELVTGQVPEVPRGAGLYPCAASVPLRTYRPVKVLATPDDARLRSLESAYPGLLLWLECEPGQVLADFERVEDGQSCRYAVMNLGADSLDTLHARVREIEDAAGIRLEPLGDCGPT
ncbi:MAG: ATP-grasp domain-containing protein [Candidatus Eisenbacteria bacterium]